MSFPRKKPYSAAKADVKCPDRAWAVIRMGTTHAVNRWNIRSRRMAGPENAGPASQQANGRLIPYPDQTAFPIEARELKK
jgi:hypothetical protein